MRLLVLLLWIASERRIRRIKKIKRTGRRENLLSRFLNEAGTFGVGLSVCCFSSGESGFTDSDSEQHLFLVCDQPSLCSQWFVVNGSGRVASACLSVYALQFLSLCNAFCSCAIYQQGIGAHSSCEQVDTSCLVFDNAGYRACDLWNSIVDTQTFFASAVENAERGTVDF